MSISKQDVENKAKNLELKTKVKNRISVDVLTLEAEELLAWSTQDKEALQKHGLQSGILDELKWLIQLTREAQVSWVTKSNNEHKLLWNKNKMGYRLLYADTIRKYKYAFRHDTGLVKRLSGMNKRMKYAEIFQGLSDLAVMGESNQEELSKVGIDSSLIETLYDKSDEGSDLMAEVNSVNRGGSELLEMRNRYSYLLQQTMKEIRQCGQFVFKNDPMRKKGYVSRSVKALNAKYRTSVTKDFMRKPGLL
ncbi:hypothetical protein E9993_10390 [Labilibacter sediminis]|nr:hypothetical protein E9993_10390 [Labilibacter sediminis]